MNVIYSCIIAISMYSKIPMPQVDWTPERMRHIMCFFPIVGLLEGLCLGGWFYIALEVMGFSVGMTSLVGAAVPVLVTGGHPSGWVSGYHGCHPFLWRQGEKAGDPEGSSCGSLCRDLCCGLCPALCRRALGVCKHGCRQGPGGHGSLCVPYVALYHGTGFQRIIRADLSLCKKGRPCRLLCPRLRRRKRAARCSFCGCSFWRQPPLHS